jgi:hypothetical protein
MACGVVEARPATMAGIPYLAEALAFVGGPSRKAARVIGLSRRLEQTP